MDQKIILLILESARDMVKSGWCQNYSNTICRDIYRGITHTSYCATSAVYVASGKYEDHGVNYCADYYYSALKHILDEILFVDKIKNELDRREIKDIIVMWNDMKERNKEEIISAFDKSIAKLR